jgi:hypothetical protein
MPGRAKFTLSLLSFVGVILFASCGGSEDGGKMSRSDFDFLRLGMSYQEVVARVGDADREVGSGIHILVYDLSDGTQFMLSFPSLDSLMAVHLYDPERDTRELILGP